MLQKVLFFKEKLIHWLTKDSIQYENLLFDFILIIFSNMKHCIHTY